MMAKISKTQKKRRATRASVGEKKTKQAAWSYTRATIGNWSALDGYLVVWRHTMDDVPVGLFKHKKDAIDAAKNMSFRTGYACAKRVDIDCRTPVCFAVVPFTAGRPGKMIFVDREDDV